MNEVGLSDRVFFGHYKSAVLLGADWRVCRPCIFPAAGVVTAVLTWVCPEPPSLCYHSAQRPLSSRGACSPLSDALLLALSVALSRKQWAGIRRLTSTVVAPPTAPLLPKRSCDGVRRGIEVPWPSVSGTLVRHAPRTVSSRFYWTGHHQVRQ